MMKQVVIIDNKLKLSKGKLARVCLSLGVNSISDMKMIGFKGYFKWCLNHQQAVILKSDNYLGELALLDAMKIKYKSHTDLGLTGVKPNTNCGCVFFLDKKHEDLFNHLKLV